LRAPDGTPLYVHLPFCAAKCTYCDFFSLAAEGHDLEAMVAAILREAEVTAPRAPHTVFLGGGTPSLLPGPLLTELLDGLQARTGFRDSAVEVTAECNPESLDRDQAARMLDGGVDRLSVGVQTLQPEGLALFGRVHGPEDGPRAFEDARAAGVRRLSIDLIYAWPGQDLEQWERDLDRLLDLGPDHVSAYNLAFEEETPLTRDLEAGRLEKLDEDLELAFFLRTREQLVGRGYGAYEISNFAPSGEQCLHNVNYWRNGPYLGLGPSAVSRVGDRRWGNPRALMRWQRAVEAGGPASDWVAWEERPGPGVRLGETWWLGLRTAEGVDPAAARRAAGWPEELEDPSLAACKELEGSGLLERAGEAWLLSERGLPLADHVARRFLEACGAPEGASPAAPGAPRE
jgi:oxygen-independent coproporphyrinogen-3 oxidase